MERKRFLLMDNDELSRVLARDVLEREGHEVVEARDAAEAVRLLRQKPPDAALLDLQIDGGGEDGERAGEGRGGAEVLAWIRRDPQFASLPVIAVTAQAMAGDRERILAEGFDGYISKPIDVKGFCASVEAVLEAKGGKERDE